MSASSPTASLLGPPRRMLVRLGRGTRARTRFLLSLAALSLGIVTEALRPRAWRRTVRQEFRRTLRQAVAGGLWTVIVTAGLVGIAIVYQALYWLDIAGQGQFVGSVLVTVLLRQVTPILVGLILLGRSGPIVLTELGTLQAGGQIATLQAQGIDPFLLLVLPRGVAFALASYTLGVVFLLAALVTGFMAGSVLGGVNLSLWVFLGDVLTAMNVLDFVLFPGKMLLIGLLIAGTACLTGLDAAARDDPGHLLPSGFVRGMLAIMVTAGVLSLIV